MISPEYDYIASGFNGFLSRRIRRPDASTLQGLSNDTPRREINFDRTTTSGSLGDTFTIGSIFLDGSRGRIDIKSTTTQETVVRLGELDE